MGPTRWFFCEREVVVVVGLDVVVVVVGFDVVVVALGLVVVVVVALGFVVVVDKLLGLAVVVVGSSIVEVGPIVVGAVRWAGAALPGVEPPLQAAKSRGNAPTTAETARRRPTGRRRIMGPSTQPPVGAVHVTFPDGSRRSSRAAWSAPVEVDEDADVDEHRPGHRCR